MSKIEWNAAGGLARIVMTNPAGNNALDLDFCREFRVAAKSIRNDTSVKAILIQALGKTFSVGGDLKYLVAHRHEIHQQITAMADIFHAAVEDLRDSNAPLIIAVNGMAAGGGFSLVCTADLAIAKRSAKFVAAYTRSGLSPDAGGTYFLPRLVGPQRAFDIFATNPTLSADEARELGIISRVVDDDLFDAEVEKIAQAIVASPPGALAALKRLLNSSASSSLKDQLAAEAKSIATLAASPSTLERLAAFVSRSKS